MTKKPVFRSDIDPTNPVAAGVLMIGVTEALRITLKALVDAKGGAGPWLDEIEESAAKAAQGILANDVKPGAEVELAKIKDAAEGMVRMFFQMAREGTLPR